MTRSLRATLTALVVGGVLGACATTPPSSFYSLSPLPRATGRAATPARDALSLGLGPVAFPAFLDRPQIVSRTSANQLELDEFNRWGGTLQDDFVRVWGENLGQLLGSSRILVLPSEIRYPLDFRVSADVLACEGTPDGQAQLEVRWSVLDGENAQVLAVRQGSYRQRLAPPGDKEALIAALSAALGDFSREVAATLRELPRPRRAEPPPAPTPPAS